MNKQKFIDIFKIIVSFVLIVISVYIFFTAYQQKRARSETICDVGAIFKDESSPFEYKGSANITEVGVKAGTACTFFKVNASTECYQITGLGTNSVTVKQLRSDDDCKAISHVSFYSTQAVSPTSTPNSPTPIPFPSDTPGPSKTPTPTMTPGPSETPNPSGSPTPSVCPKPNAVTDIEISCPSCTQ